MPPAPRFSAQEHELISAWVDKMRNGGLRTEVTSEYKLIEEALVVIPWGETEPLWMVHKTPTGAVAVRLWPGPAEIVPTVAEALAMISIAADGHSR